MSFRGGRLVVLGVFLVGGIGLLADGKAAAGLVCLALGVVYVPVRVLRERLSR